MRRVAARPVRSRSGACLTRSPAVTVALVLLLAIAVAAAAVLAVVARRRGQRIAATDHAVVALARAMSEEGSSREHLTDAARQIAGAEVAYLVEPDRREPVLNVTAAAGAELAGLSFPLDEPFPTVRAYLDERPVHVPDLDAVAASAEVRARTHARSLHLRPVRRGDHVVAVLGLLWRRPVRELSSDRAELVALLAAEAGRAVERDARYALLARQARTDELTALPNRRAWDEALERELSRAQRTEQPLCLALLDLDHFKSYNDTRGHQAGDAHLRRTAAAWRRQLRAVDVLARYGGEEFGVLLPATGLAEATDAIDRVRVATPHGETASAGVVQWDGHESADALLARADAALYQAKEAGRALTQAA